MTAWALAQAGHRVELFERGRLMAATSSASTKLLHGGLRYLETGHLRLVREALHERAWWIAQAPQLARPIRLLLPIHGGSGGSPRPAWQVKLGLMLYDGQSNSSRKAALPAAIGSTWSAAAISSSTSLALRVACSR